MSTWIYVQLFPGGAGRAEQTIRDVVGPLRRLAFPERWFFLRYFDERGPHVRLRFLVPDEQLEQTHALLNNWGRELLKRTSLLPAVTEPHIIKVPPYMRASGRHVGLHYAAYEPELEKYGGAEGVTAAEEVFETSSDIVLDQLPDTWESSAERVAYCSVHMAAAVKRCIRRSRKQDSYLTTYTDHWTRAGTARGDQIRSRLDELTPKLVAAVQPHYERIMQDEQLVAQTSSLADDVERGVRAGAKSPSKPDRLGLLFHQLHMTNNRFGLNPVEEPAAAVVTQAALANDWAIA